MTPEQTVTAAQLFKALSGLAAVRRRLTDKRSKYQDCVHLELAAAEMLNGEGQGSSAYIYLPAAAGREVLNAAEKIIRDNLTKIGVTLPRKQGKR